jgi:hypothetical protein
MELGGEMEATDDDMQAQEIRLAATTMGFAITSLRVTTEGQYLVDFVDHTRRSQQFGPGSMERISSLIYLHGLP